jgi:L-ascorbate metabolism protein UlaG (beta-lactamase superfamily)
MQSNENPMARRRFLAQGSRALAVSSLVPSVVAAVPGPASLAGRTIGMAPDMQIQRLSWAGLKIELGKTTVLIDPLHDASSADTIKSAVPIVLTTELRYVLVTHIHIDHYDPVAARNSISARGHVVCHTSLAPMVAAEGIRVRPVDLYQPLLLRGGDLSVVAVQALDGQGDDQVSWIVSGGGRRLIHCGDTAWHFYWWKLAAAYGPFDAAFLPINGVLLTRVPPSGVPASLTPEQAVAAAHILGARILCPIHYGDNAPPDYVEAPDAEGRVLKAARERNVTVQIVQPGGAVQLPPRLGGS